MEREDDDAYHDARAARGAWRIFFESITRLNEEGRRIRRLYAHYDEASGVTSIKSFRKNYVFVKSMRSITAVSHITWTLQKSTTATHNIRPINESDLMQPSLTRTS